MFKRINDLSKRTHPTPQPGKAARSRRSSQTPPEPSVAENIARALHPAPDQGRPTLPDPIAAELGSPQHPPRPDEDVSDIAFRAAVQAPVAEAHAGEALEAAAQPVAVAPTVTAQPEAAPMATADVGPGTPGQTRSGTGDGAARPGLVEWQRAMLELYRDAAVASLSFWTTLLQPPRPKAADRKDDGPAGSAGATDRRAA